MAHCMPGKQAGMSAHCIPGKQAGRSARKPAHDIPVKQGRVPYHRRIVMGLLTPRKEVGDTLESPIAQRDRRWVRIPKEREDWRKL
jgi:hypothetical protein